ncbi:hypothetical protein SLEP1_g19255 [Rubroshorea leprosula]|nr:hypothetical protein SLEP1_g19255 [Rubroshorea leprosula]
MGLNLRDFAGGRVRKLREWEARRGGAKGSVLEGRSDGVRMILGNLTNQVDELGMHEIGVEGQLGNTKSWKCSARGKGVRGSDSSSTGETGKRKGVRDEFASTAEGQEKRSRNTSFVIGEYQAERSYYGGASRLI